MGIKKNIAVVVGCLALGLGAVGGCVEGCNNYTVSEGVRVGKIHKISKKGVFFKTQEGSLALQGLSEQGANLWNFSIDRQARNGENADELAGKTREYLDSQETVKVHYKEPFKVWPWRGNTKYFIQKIEPIKDVDKE